MLARPIYKLIENSNIDWDGFNENPNGIFILEKYPEKINFNYFVHNKSPNKISIIQKNIKMFIKKK